MNETKVDIDEINDNIIGHSVISFEINKGDSAICADEEIQLNFDNGQEMIIFINDEGNIEIDVD